MTEDGQSVGQGAGGRAGLFGAVALALLAGFVWGGYGAGWAWTGLSSEVTLWDWLEALALPVTIGMVPLLLQHRRRLHRPHKVAASVVSAGFGLLVLLGYVVPWDWTGFRGNTLWDWWELALLPAVVATLTLWRRPGRLTARHYSIASIIFAVVVFVTVAGYLVPWDWTGVEGNTAWDWIKLLLLPVLLPTLVLPRLVRAAHEWMVRQPAQSDG
jgi:hypothetical protein